MKTFSKSLLPIALTGMLASCGSAPTTDNNSELDIRGGTNVSENDLTNVRRSTVALTSAYTGPNGGGDSILEQGGSFCTGTIIGTRTIVTAAHCLQALEGRTQKGDLIFPNASDYLVHFGSKVSADGPYIKAAKVIPHPDWNPGQTLSPVPLSAPNDIGLVILSEDIPSDMIITKIADFDIDIDNQPAILAGYGVSRSRNSNDTGVLRTLTTRYTGESKNIGRVSHGTFLKGICAGDSGGPAYVEVDGELQLVGAASTGIEIPLLGCVGAGSNSTDVRFYKDWIEANSELQF